MYTSSLAIVSKADSVTFDWWNQTFVSADWADSIHVYCATRHTQLCVS